MGLLIITVVGFIPYAGGLIALEWVALVWERLPGRFTARHDRQQRLSTAENSSANEPAHALAPVGPEQRGLAPNAMGQGVQFVLRAKRKRAGVFPALFLIRAAQRLVP